MDSDRFSVLSTAPPSYCELESEPWMPSGHEAEPQNAGQSTELVVNPHGSPPHLDPIETHPRERSVSPRPPLPPRRPSEQSREAHAASLSSRRALAPPPQDVVLSWNPESPATVPSNMMSLAPATYLFSPSSFNSMLLLPSAGNETADTRPLYHISVHLNCLMPSSYITIIRRGASESGHYVGEFEMGISKELSSVTLDRHRSPIGRVMTSIYAPMRDRKDFRWKFGDTEFIWKVMMKPTYRAVCTLKPEGLNKPPEFAVLVPGQLSGRVADVEDRLTTIRILPVGRSFIDHIVVSALILERMRLTPSGPEASVMFNYSTNLWT